MAWVVLFIAGIFETCWAVALKASGGFTRPWPTAAFGVSMVISVGLLGVAMRTLPLGTAYAVWTGIGTVGAVLVGVAFLGEAATPARLLCMALIVAGIVGLKLTSPS